MSRLIIKENYFPAIDARCINSVTAVPLSRQKSCHAIEMSSLSRCSLRFPSTSIWVYFQSLVADDSELLPPPSLVSPPREKRRDGEGGMRPLTISIPSGNEANYEASPPSSPTGTISVPNSCPTSPNSHRIFNPYSHYRPVTQHTPTIAQVELEETKPDLNLLTHNAVVYPTEDGGLSTVPVDPSPPIQVETKTILVLVQLY